MRQLKYHEKKLLKKVDFLKWKSENNLRELQVSRREKEGENKSDNVIRRMLPPPTATKQKNSTSTSPLS